MDYPKYYLSRKNTNGKKPRTVFKRNYLSLEDFTETENGWEFEEEFECLGISCYLQVILRSQDIFGISQLNTKSMKVKGGKKQFGIHMKFDIKTVPFSQSCKNEGIYCYLECTGKGFPEDERAKERAAQKKKAARLAAKEAKKNPKIHVSKKYTLSKKKGPKYSSYTNAGYNITHPYSGGGVSPR